MINLLPCVFGVSRFRASSALETERLFFHLMIVFQLIDRDSTHIAASLLTMYLTEVFPQFEPLTQRRLAPTLLTAALPHARDKACLDLLQQLVLIMESVDVSSPAVTFHIELMLFAGATTVHKREIALLISSVFSNSYETTAWKTKKGVALPHAWERTRASQALVSMVCSFLEDSCYESANTGLSLLNSLCLPFPQVLDTKEDEDVLARLYVAALSYLDLPENATVDETYNAALWFFFLFFP